MYYANITSNKYDRPSFFCNTNNGIRHKPTTMSYDTSEDQFSSQEKSNEELSTSSATEYGWNFNYTNKWNEFAYVDGNTTELVVGLRNA